MDKVDDAPRKKTWRDLIGAAGSVDGPTDIAERHDYYLGKSLSRSMGSRSSPLKRVAELDLKAKT